MQTDKKGVVLVVDDVESEIDILVDILHHDYEVCVAMDGENALEAAESIQPDLILLDVLMPDMDGYEVCRRLKANPQTLDIPIIFVTVLSEEGQEATGLNLGALDYITKPFNRDIVLARVRNHMELIEAHRLKQDVNRIISHDMRNELAVIINCPDILLRSTNLDTEQRKLISKIRQSGFVLLNLVNLELQLYKMERGLYQFRPCAVDVYAILDTILECKEEFCRQKVLVFRITEAGLPPSPGTKFLVQSEELMLHSMLFNLISNAIEASPPGELISIDLRQQEDKIIEIHNYGAVPLSIRDRFFGKYVTAGKEAGTGLGAYSALLMAKTHGGTIDMQTSDQLGTTIRVHLPA
jgi:two-component system, sensor histidine kinase and response regulator